MKWQKIEKILILNIKALRRMAFKTITNKCVSTGLCIYIYTIVTIKLCWLDQVLTLIQ